MQTPEPNSPKPIIVATGLSYRYKRKWVFEHLTVEVHEHTLNLLSGNNGSGKTTLLKLLAGGLQPKAGKITHHWKDQLSRQAYLPAYNLLDVNLNLVEQAKQLETIPGFSSEEFLGNCAALSTLAEPNQRLKTLSSGTLRKVNISAIFSLKNSDLVFIDELDELLDEESLPLLSAMLARQIEAGKTIITTLQHTHWLEANATHLHKIQLNKPSLTHV